jgi:hypothetical protein
VLILKQHNGIGGEDMHGMSRERESDRGPPKLDVVKTVPQRGDKVLDVEPILYHVPNAYGEVAPEEKVSGRLIMTSAKGANSSIGSTSFLKAVRRPHTVLEDKPSEDLAFGRGANLPNNGIHARPNSPGELSIVVRRRRADPIVGKLPNNRVWYNVDMVSREVKDQSLTNSFR